ncbi:maestro heat-like repeat-containing protein family member 7 [Anomalospiza imberbis]|uniref:maestro heat-like repeat-containing protein family member 7 n=1 Tax=Anomalospiza imberbis TaxID=187417 RepID=UPI00358E08D7
MERDKVSKGPAFVTRGDIGAGGDKSTPQCSEQATGQDGTERCRAFKAQLHNLLTQNITLPSSLKVPSRSYSGMANRFLSVFKVFRKKKKEDPGAAPAQQHEELEQFQPPQDGAALDRTQEQEPSRGHFRRSLKALSSSMTEDVAITNRDNEETQGLTNTDTTPAPAMIHAPTMEFFEESAVPSQQQVPAKVKNIHQRLVSHVSVDARLQIDLVRLAEEHPADVVLTLLRCAPTCDRAAAVLWRAIGSSGPAVEKVLPTLLCVMEDWPLTRMCTSDGDNKDIFSLAATLVIWVIVQVPECHEALILYSSRLFVALLFHVVTTTQLMPPEEVGNFWRACQEEHRLPSKPNRFAVQAMKALLYRLQYDNVVEAMEHMGGWDTLLCADTQHYAVGLLAREMLCVFMPLCSCITIHLLRHLSREEPYWDLPFLAFLVEVSLLASAASLSCLPALCPLVATAARTVPTPCAAAWAQPCAVLGPALPGHD